MAVQLNTAQFTQRIAAFQNLWTSATKRDGAEVFADLDGFVHVYGERTSEDEQVKKSTAFQTWLLGFEFPATITLITKEKVYFLTSQTKTKYLSQLHNSGSSLEIVIFTIPKGKEDDATPKMAAVFGELKRVGHIPKDIPSGKFADVWNAAVAALDSKPEMVDATAGISAVLGTKDEEELKLVKIAGNLTSTLMTHHITGKLEVILDKESRISHAAFAEQVESKLGSGEGNNADMRIWSNGRGLTDVDFASAEFVYSPIIQSRSTANGYDLRSSAESSTDLLAHKGVVLVSVGMKYKGYCANLGRTFIVDPTKEQERVYQILVQLQSELLGKMTDGTPAKDVYNHAVTFIREKNPDLEKHFVKNIGFAMGIEFRDGSFLLSPKSTRIISAGMVFNLSLGFQDMEEPNGQKYALQVIDTVRITRDKALLLTEGSKTSRDVFFYLNTDEDTKKSTKPKEKTKSSAANGAASPDRKTAGSKVLRNKTRGAAQQDTTASVATRITDHQRQLHSQLQDEGMKKYAGGVGTAKGHGEKGWKRFASYKGEAGLPREAEQLKIWIDKKNMSVILPIYGFATPFHINAIKNASKSDEGDYTLLRINFQTPGQLTGKKEDTPFEDPDATFLRSITYRSLDNARFETLYKQITELKKEANKRDQQKKEMADVIEQDNLIEMKGGRRPLKLPEVFVRPALDGKRLPGEVEIHENGLRYVSPVGSQRIDILFSNIKHLFFQPCDKELIVLIHVHLKSPIMIGKKKAKDVQFYREATDMQFDETGNRKRKFRYGDEDELELEQMERKRRQQLNREFKHYAEKIGEAASTFLGEELEVDIPFSDMGFEGVPSRANVKLYPTMDCLVQLSEPPFIVVTLGDIEVASLERVQFGLKQFDLVLLFNDYQRPPLQINTIPSAQLDALKEWLDSVDIPLTESGVNLNWSQIMKTINEHPLDFFQNGGWSFLGGPGEAGDAKSASEDSGSESAYSGESEQSESESEEVSSEFDGSDASEESGSFSGESDDGEDWDELERRAAKSDKKRHDEKTDKRGGNDSDDSDRPKKKVPAKSSGPSKSNGAGKSNGAAKSSSAAKGKAPPPKGKR
ncbi:FACT complex subunit SPT16 [Auriculariales sp. MPI-PUGE-AT-0066]|nr:FACT complex subunit SPT16 [Auriculariales sp. MPI-PUGE-AT-0066]